MICHEIILCNHICILDTAFVYYLGVHYVSARFINLVPYDDPTPVSPPLLAHVHRVIDIALSGL